MASGSNTKKRMSNPRRKERRQRSWLRGERRHEVNRNRNEQRRADNLAHLKELGGKVQTKTYVNKRGKLVTKNESPSEALARTIRQANGWTHHIPREA